MLRRKTEAGDKKQASPEQDNPEDELKFIISKTNRGQYWKDVFLLFVFSQCQKNTCPLGAYEFDCILWPEGRGDVARLLIAHRVGNREF